MSLNIRKIFFSNLVQFVQTKHFDLMKWQYCLLINQVSELELALTIEFAIHDDCHTF